jgi:hypothetical protein
MRHRPSWRALTAAPAHPVRGPAEVAAWPIRLYPGARPSSSRPCVNVPDRLKHGQYDHNCRGKSEGSIDRSGFCRTAHSCDCRRAGSVAIDVKKLSAKPPSEPEAGQDDPGRADRAATLKLSRRRAHPVAEDREETRRPPANDSLRPAGARISMACRWRRSTKMKPVDVNRPVICGRRPLSQPADFPRTFCPGSPSLHSSP